MLGRLRALKELGVLVSVDDTGAGYSALSRLRHVPIDAIKIDRSFVAAMGRLAEAVSSVHNLVQLAGRSHRDARRGHRAELAARKPPG